LDSQNNLEATKPRLRNAERIGERFEEKNEGKKGHDPQQAKGKGGGRKKGGPYRKGVNRRGPFQATIGGVKAKEGEEKNGLFAQPKKKTKEGQLKKPKAMNGGGQTFKAGKGGK